MVNKIIAQTTIKDCTIFKLGGSYAVSLNKNQIKKAGLAIGMPVDVTLKLYDDALEPAPDYDEDIEVIEDLLKNYENKSIEEISRVAEEFGYLSYKQDGEAGYTEEKYKADIKIELLSQLKFMKDEMAALDIAMSFSEQDIEDELDYEKQGSKLLDEV